jgi:hypothetical protein
VAVLPGLGAVGVQQRHLTGRAWVVARRRPGATEMEEELREQLPLANGPSLTTLSAPARTYAPFCRMQVA